MVEIASDDRLRRIARTYIWWTPPERSLETIDRLVAQVMEFGTWEDANWLLGRLGPDAFIKVLEAPPPGVLSPKSWTFWHIRLLGGTPTKPAPTSRHLP
jgi:hypothetical protein